MVQQQFPWVTTALQAPAEHLAANHPSLLPAAQQLCSVAENITKSLRNFVSRPWGSGWWAQLGAGELDVGSWLARAVPATELQVTLQKAINLTLECFVGPFPLEHLSQALFLPGMSDLAADTTGTCTQAMDTQQHCCPSERSMACGRSSVKSYSRAASLYSL